ncbi:MAG: LPS export ABC transporter periplasmic protein LptC [Novosphingobium sp.]|nr:LPS export ABC transporter periplasmic protein LptC [Novosphingobium sp.]
MSEQADIIRDHRREFAAPNGAHDKLVAWLTKALPAGIGVLAALMLLLPFAPRGDISFLLDRNQVAIIKDRLRVENAMYRGVDDKGRPFSLTAGKAVQHSSREALVRMEGLKASILLKDGPALLSASNGRYDIDSETVTIDGPVQFTAADGYRMVARDVSVNLETRQLVGNGKIDGSTPAGTFSADHISADLGERIVALYGNARLHMTPGQLRMPQ